MVSSSVSPDTGACSTRLNACWLASISTKSVPGCPLTLELNDCSTPATPLLSRFRYPSTCAASSRFG